MSATIQQARDRYLQRIEVYKSVGCDRPAAVRWAVDWFVSNGFRPIVLEEGHLHTVAVLQRQA